MIFNLFLRFFPKNGGKICAKCIKIILCFIALSGNFAAKFPHFAVLMDEKTIKSNIYRRRRTLSISQTEMAERLGLDRNTYRNIESGSTRIFNSHLEEIARLLGVSSEELVLGYRAGDPENDPRLQDAQAVYDSRVEALKEEYEHRLAEEHGRILALEKRIAELEESLHDKSEIIAFLREKARPAAESGGK